MMGMEPSSKFPRLSQILLKNNSLSMLCNSLPLKAHWWFLIFLCGFFTWAGVKPGCWDRIPASYHLTTLTPSKIDVAC